MSVDTIITTTKEASPLVFTGLYYVGLDLQTLVLLVILFYNLVLIVEKAPVLCRIWRKFKSLWSKDGG